jgi:hypothetical protein
MAGTGVPGRTLAISVFGHHIEHLLSTAGRHQAIYAKEPCIATRLTFRCT